EGVAVFLNARRSRVLPGGIVFVVPRPLMPAERREARLLVESQVVPLRRRLEEILQAAALEEPGGAAQDGENRLLASAYEPDHDLQLEAFEIACVLVDVHGVLAELLGVGLELLRDVLELERHTSTELAARGVHLALDPDSGRRLDADLRLA